jgi:glutamate synthase domain-containing protein 1
MLDSLPPKQGLYDPRLEKDSCGVGAVIDKEGAYTHKTGLFLPSLIVESINLMSDYSE